MAPERDDSPDARSPGGNGGADHESIEVLLWRYIDRINAGETIQAAEVHADHPEHADEILEQLEAFQGIDTEFRPEEPLGTLGDYTLRRKIGRGGMGVVYEAWQHSLHRLVALKVLPPGIAADARSSTRFLREAQIAAQLGHRNIVPVFASGVEGDTPFYAMEYIEGETLAHVLAKLRDAEPETETPFGKKDRVEYFTKLADAFADVADGLQHAHAKGVIHRDIKPSNLILDSEGRLRILDFGLAHLEGQESLTISGDVVGTPLYMSPEQARRRKIPVDQRTDIYSLGATMYEALCGRPPLRGKDHRDTLSQIIERDPVEPRKVNRRVPEDLQTVVLKCLRKGPGDRYGTAEALSQDLKRFVRGDPIEARPLSSFEYTLRRLRRARRKLALAFIAVGLLGAGVWFECSRREAERQMRLAKYDERVLEEVVKIQTGRFSLEASTGRGGAVLSLKKHVVAPVRAEELRRLLAEEDSGCVNDAVQGLEQLSHDHPEKRDAHYHLARVYKLLGRREDARREAEQALACSDGREFVPAKVLLWELEDEPGGLEGEQLASLAGNDVASEAEDWGALWLRAYKAFRGREWEEAVRAYKALAELKDVPYVGSELESYVALGLAQLDKGDYARAQGSFRVAHVLAGGLEPVLLLAKAYCLDGKKKLAEETLAEVARTEPERGALLAAMVCDSLNEYEHGLEWARKIREPALNERFQAGFFLRLGKTQNAIEAARRAVRRNPRDPIAHLIEGLALFRELRSRSRDRPDYAADLARLADVTAETVELGAREPLAEGLTRGVLELASYVDTWRSTRRESMEFRERRQRLATAAAVFGLSLGSVSAQEVLQIGPYAGTFGDPREVSELNGDCSWTQIGPSLTDDGLVVVFSRGRDEAFGLYMATREDEEDPFGRPVPLDELNISPRNYHGNISPDGLEIVLDGCADAAGCDLFIAKRGRREDDGQRVPFGDPVPLGAPINTDECKEWDGHISRDGLKLYFTRSGCGSTDLFVAIRPNQDIPWNDDSVEVMPLVGAHSPYADTNSSLSAGGEVMFWANAQWSAEIDVWFAESADDTGTQFANPQKLPFPINTSELEMFPWISADWPAAGSKLYFVRRVVGCNWMIYEAEWHPVSPVGPFRRGDCNDDAIVDISDAVCILNWLFLGGAAPGCLAVTDTNGDARADLSDAVYLLGHLFLGGPAPVEPFPACGTGSAEDYDEEQLGCETPPASCRTQ